MESEHVNEATETVQIICYCATWILGALAGLARAWRDHAYCTWGDICAIALVSGFLSFGLAATCSLGRAFELGPEYSWMGWSALAGLVAKEILHGLDKYVLKKFGLSPENEE